MSQSPGNSNSDSAIDPLTGLYNRSRLENLDGEYSRRNSPWSALVMDVDHFKLINDIYGHLTGDRVLKQTALTLQMNLKKTDIAIRFGGDEFVVFLPETAQDGALDLAQRLISEIRRISFSSGLRVSTSIGVSQSRASDTSISSLVSRADAALYRAKESGRGQFYFSADGITEDSTLEINFSHMVGRRNELQKLRQLLEESVTESSRFAIITGDAGVGKTRIVEELFHYSDFMKTELMRYAAVEHTQSQPFSILLEPLRQSLAGLNSQDFETLCARIQPVHPATMDLFPELTSSVSSDTVFFREERVRFRVFRDIASILEAISALLPVTFIVEDVQWASPQDIALLSYTARNTAAGNILFVCTMRRNEASETVYKSLYSVGSSIPLLTLNLKKLKPEETANLILFALKDPDIPAEVQHFLTLQSGGNPLFLRELLDSCIESGYISRSKTGEMSYMIPEDLQVPETIGQVITAKLESVSVEASDLLRTASLSPDHFSLAMLRGVLGGDGVETARKLDECIGAGLIEEVHEEDGGVSFRFTHGAVRDYLSSELPLSLQVTYHRRMAAYFEGLLERGRTELLTAVAHHYAGSDDRKKAAEYALKAGNQAFNRGASRDAIKWYDTFLEFIGDEDEKTLFTLNINLGSLYSITGRAEDADIYLNKALELAREPRQLAAVNLRLGRNNLFRSRYPETLANYQEAMEWCEEGDASDTVIFRTKIQTLVEMSFVQRLQGHYGTALELLDRAEILLEDEEEPENDLTACFFTRKADVLSELDSDSEALTLYSRALEIYSDLNDLHGQGTVLNNMHAIYSSIGDFEESLNLLEQVIEINRRLDDRLGLAIAYYNMAEYYYEINMLDLSRDYYDRYMELNDAIGNQLGLGYGSYGLGSIHLHEGELEKSRSCFKRAKGIFEKLSVFQMVTACSLMLADIHIQLSEFAQAREIIDGLDRSALTPGNLSDMNYLAGLLDMLESPSDRKVLKGAVKIFRDVIISTDSHSSVALARYYSALVRGLRLLGEEDEAVAALREGTEKLADRLGGVTRFSIRNSLMTRREIQDFLTMCREMELPFPPKGYDLKVVDSAAGDENP